MVKLTAGSVDGIRAGRSTIGMCWRGRTSYSSGMSWRQELVIFTFGVTVTSVRPSR